MYFYGEYLLTLDEKGRISIPAEFRTLENIKIDHWVITRGFEKNLLLYPINKWKEVVESINKKFNYKDKKQRVFLRFFIYPAKEVFLDKQGRFVIPKQLKEWAEIEKEAIYLGAIDKIELWSAKRWEKYNKENFNEINSYLEEFDINL